MAALALLGLCLVLIGALVIPVAVVLAAARTIRAARVRGAERTKALVSAGVWLAGAVALVAIPFVATPFAESENGWVDHDGNGVLDPMSNGSYDWVDINGGTWLATAGLLAAWVVGALALSVACVDFGWRPFRGTEREDFLSDPR